MKAEESILDSVKKLNNLYSDYDTFDTDMILNINQVFASLAQMGVGPPAPVEVQNKNDGWDLFSEDPITIGLVKTYVALKVRQVFDPPSSSILSQAIDNRCNELEFRLRVQGGEV